MALGSGVVVSAISAEVVGRIQSLQLDDSPVGEPLDDVDVAMHVGRCGMQAVQFALDDLGAIVGPVKVGVGVWLKADARDGHRRVSRPQRPRSGCKCPVHRPDALGGEG